MLFNDKDELTQKFKNIAVLTDEGAKIDNADKLRGEVLDQLVQNAVLNPSAEIKGLSRFFLKSAALELGIVSSSIQGLYDARGRGEVKGFTVPALNIRGLPYELCRAIFRTFLQFFAFFSHFGRILNHHCIFHRSFSIFHRFGEDLGWIWGGFWDDFLKIFRIFLKIADPQNSCAHAVFLKGPAFKN